MPACRASPRDPGRRRPSAAGCGPQLPPRFAPAVRRARASLPCELQAAAAHSSMELPFDSASPTARQPHVKARFLYAENRSPDLSAGENPFHDLLDAQGIAEARHGVGLAGEEGAEVVQHAPVAVQARVRQVGQLVLPASPRLDLQAVPVPQAVGRFSPQTVISTWSGPAPPELPAAETGTPPQSSSARKWVSQSSGRPDSARWHRTAGPGRRAARSGRRSGRRPRARSRPRRVRPARSRRPASRAASGRSAGECRPRPPRPGGPLQRAVDECWRPGRRRRGS